MTLEGAVNMLVVSPDMPASVVPADRNVIPGDKRQLVWLSRINNLNIRNIKPRVLGDRRVCGKTPLRCLFLSPFERRIYQIRVQSSFGVT